MAYDVAAIRNKLRSQVGGRQADPDEWKPPKVESLTEPVKFRFFVLPPFQAGDILSSGQASRSMDNFFLIHGSHWLGSTVLACPRVCEGEDCPICQVGFDRVKKIPKDQAEERRKITGQWIANNQFMVNILFTNHKMNPEELRGKVKFFNASKTILDIWSATLMRDDAGDDDDPQAHGVFFDENAAFLFQLEVIKQGKGNSYKTSKFIHNDGKPLPIADQADIPKILKKRHDLFLKVPKVDMKKVDDTIRKLLAQEESGDDGGGGFDSDETASSKSSTSSTTSSTKKRSEKVQNPDDEVADTLIEESEEDIVSASTEKASTASKKQQDKKPDEGASSSSKKEEKKTEKQEKPKDDDDEDDDINSLLSQLDDD